MTVETRAPIE